MADFFNTTLYRRILGDNPTNEYRYYVGDSYFRSNDYWRDNRVNYYYGDDVAVDAAARRIQRSQYARNVRPRGQHRSRYNPVLAEIPEGAARHRMRRARNRVRERSRQFWQANQFRPINDQYGSDIY